MPENADGLSLKTQTDSAHMYILAGSNTTLNNSKMAKTISSCYALCLLASVLLNIFLVSNKILYEGNGSRSSTKKLTWTEAAAAEAETVAAISCSGHGRAYLDGVSDDNGSPVCECNSCFEGPDCSEFQQNCSADASSGDPLFLEPFWEQNAASSAVVMAGWHRMSYTFPGKSYVSQQLEDHIRKLHAIARNANTQGRYIVFGVGSTELLNTAVYALSMKNISSTAKVVASSPYYPVYRDQTNFFKTIHYEFAGDASSLLKNNSDNIGNVIEFVTSPNNPDGLLKKPVLQGPSVATIYDHAYYWPHFTAIPAPSDEDIMLFTISKLTGHAGSRFGWALIKDDNVYQWMSNYILAAEMGISKETQLRALKLLKVILDGDGRHIFNFAHERMKARWEKMNQIVSFSKRFTLQEIPPQYCSFFQKVRGPSPVMRTAYAWLKCEKAEDTDCSAVLEAANIIGRKGSRYGADDSYVRLSLIKRQDDFDLLLQRLKELVSKEEAGTATLR